jgi:RNA polymerase sigma factor (TIGR02999 family)
MPHLRNDRGDVTQLLIDAGRGDEVAYNQLFPLIYDELRVIAHHQLMRRPADGQFQKTELIHEMYLKLIDQAQAGWKDRAHFFTVAAKAMRHILVDRYRKQKAKKRGGTKEILEFDEEKIEAVENAGYLEELHELMNTLEKANRRMHSVIDLRFFAGMSIEEVADLLNVSRSTIDRDWKAARLWLYKNLTDET